uniref:C-type lectin domain-containing protein n=1 Tax=Scophthalmus maximus TaxID=52904 RepID=A0A8D3CLA6_SCOMX
LPALSGCGSSSKRCPANWIEMNRRCYFMSSERRTWDDSRTDCQIKGADLVVINSELEQFISFDKFVRSFPSPVWIGLSDEEKEGEWKWVNGSVVTET